MFFYIKCKIFGGTRSGEEFIFGTCDYDLYPICTKRMMRGCVRVRVRSARLLFTEVVEMEFNLTMTFQCNEINFKVDTAYHATFFINATDNKLL